MRYTLKYIATIAVLTIGLTACGLAEASTPETNQPGIDVGEPAPGTGNPSDTCLPDVPECEDVVTEPIAFEPIDIEGDQPGDGDVIGSGELIDARANEVTVWAESFQALWEDRLDSLEDVLAAMQAARTDIQTTTDKKEGST